MTFSLIIPTFNRPEEIKNLLSSILQQTFLPREVIIVDQSSDQRTRDLVESERNDFDRLGIKLIYLWQQDRSSARSRNRGVKVATGDVVSFVDDDIVLLPDYLQRVSSYMKDLAIVGVSGNVIAEPEIDGIKWKVRRFLLQTFLLNHFNAKLTLSGFGYPFFEKQVRNIQQAIEVELFPGYSMNFRREIFLQEMFDEWFSGYSFREDVDLSYRMSKHGKLLMVPDARFYHHHSSANRLDLINLKKMQFRNCRYVFSKHRPQNIFYISLFWYSLLGLFLMDMIEFLLNRNQSKWAVVKANWVGVWALRTSK